MNCGPIESTSPDCKPAKITSGDLDRTYPQRSATLAKVVDLPLLHRGIVTVESRAELVSAIVHRHEKEVLALIGIDHRLKSRRASASDGARWQTFDLVGVVRVL